MKLKNKAAISNFSFRIKKYCHTKLDLVSMFMQSTQYNKFTAMLRKMSQLYHILSSQSRGTTKRKNAKNCFADLKGKRSVVNILNNAKSAAMFGLDARIALAIFGALSIITGAALYSALNKLEVTTLLADINELGKAFEQYWLDTGHTIPRRTTLTTNQDFHLFDVHKLVDGAGIKNWKGPYLPYPKIDGKPHDLGYPRIEGANFSILSLDDNAALGGSSFWNTALCTKGKSCSLWIDTYPIERDIFDKLDSMIDNGDGVSSGDVRYMTSPAKYLYYRYMPLSNPLN